MLFEVTSFNVAKNIDYIVQNNDFRYPVLVVLLPSDNTPLRTIVHGEDWKTVQCFMLCGFDDKTIERYRSLNAIIISTSFENITIIDLNGYAILELTCKYREAVEYLEYLLQETY